MHDWLTDESGEKAFNSKDTIRAEFWGNVHGDRLGNSLIPSSTRLPAEGKVPSSSDTGDDHALLARFAGLRA